MKKVKNKQIWT